MVFFIAAAATLMIGFVAGISRNQYRLYIRKAERNPLSEEQVDSLRQQSTKPSLAAGRAKQELLMYDRPDFVRRQVRLLSAVTRISFACAAILAFAGCLVLVL